MKQIYRLIAIALSLITSTAKSDGFENAYLFLEGGHTKLSNKDRIVYHEIFVLSAHKNKTSATNNKKHTGGALVGGGLGLKIDENFRADISLTFLSTRTGKAEGFFNNYPAFLKANLKSQIIMINGYYDFANFSENLMPYIGGGIGLTKNKYNLGMQYGQPGNTSGAVDIYNKTKPNFAWQAGGGTFIKFKDNIDLKIGYRYMDLGKIKIINQYGEPMKTFIKTHQMIGGAQIDL